MCSQHQGPLGSLPSTGEKLIPSGGSQERRDKPSALQAAQTWSHTTPSVTVTKHGRTELSKGPSGRHHFYAKAARKK